MVVLCLFSRRCRELLLVVVRCEGSSCVCRRGRCCSSFGAVRRCRNRIRRQSRRSGVLLVCVLSCPAKRDLGVCSSCGQFTRSSLQQSWPPQTRSVCLSACLLIFVAHDGVCCQAVARAFFRARSRFTFALRFYSNDEQVDFLFVICVVYCLLVVKRLFRSFGLHCGSLMRFAMRCLVNLHLCFVFCRFCQQASC